MDLFFYLFGEKSLSTCFSSFNIAFLPLNRSSANNRSNNSNFSFPNPARYSLRTSCNVSTLARDLVRLVEVYDIHYIQSVDMFPHTARTEAVVKLIKKV